MTLTPTKDTLTANSEESYSGVRLAGLTACVIGSFVAYVYGSQLLNTVLVSELHINRSDSADAFGPFVTLLGLVYSVVLSQVYSYYFDRQGQIQDALYQETAALRTLYEASSLLTERCDKLQPADRREMLAILHRVSSDTLQTAFDEILYNEERSTRPLLALLGTLEVAANGENPKTVALCGDAVDRLIGARARRLSAIAAELPPVQTITQRVISAVLLLGFVLVDLGSPTLEAVLFSTISGCFFLIASFLDDLANPFGGSWSCDPAKEELTRLAEAIDRDLVGACVEEEI